MHSIPASWPTHMHRHLKKKKNAQMKQTNKNPHPWQILREGPTESAARQVSSKACPPCLSLRGGAESPEAGSSEKLCARIPNFWSPFSLFAEEGCRFPFCTDSFRRTNKQRRSPSRALCKLQVIKTACKCPDRKHFKEPVIPAMAGQDCVV